ncbi:hypothetical protein [Mangrovibacterium lignilyticum]|uniref:hypothetical protein n=1 Tax=Mangrovibacterium lignilyticum TaxID=2668052 RepID=UPI0013D3EEB3|nr:hypothetical protein [Mangrovibacterium lignilyticum]
MVSSRKNRNKLSFGFTLAMLLPMVVFVVLYFLSKREITLGEYLVSLWRLGAFLKIMSLCVLPNLILFLHFYRIKYDLAARGVLMATFFYAFVVVLSKAL